MSYDMSCVLGNGLIKVDLEFSLKLACFIYFTFEISVMGRTEIFVMECTDRKICTTHYINFWRKVDETKY